MISRVLAKLYGIILEYKIDEWIEMAGKQDKGRAGFRRNHSNTNHLIMLRIIAHECRNNNSSLFCCFVDFRKAFDTVPRNNMWNRQDELKVPFELIASTIRLHEKVTAKFKNNEG